MKHFAAFCGTAVAVLLVLFFCVTAVSAFAPAFSGGSGAAFGTGSGAQSSAVSGSDSGGTGASGLTAPDGSGAGPGHLFMLIIQEKSSNKSCNRIRRRLKDR